MAAISNEVSAGFYAIAYELGGQKIISYRGTDSLFEPFWSVQALIHGMVIVSVRVARLVINRRWLWHFMRRSQEAGICFPPTFPLLVIPWAVGAYGGSIPRLARGSGAANDNPANDNYIDGINYLAMIA